MYSKMNVLHLHLSDSQSFPLELTTGHGPEITKHGAYSSDEIYTTKDVAALNAYAKARGVTLIPEIDTPGHARAFGLAPGLHGIVSCAGVPGVNYTQCCKEPPCGQLNPASDLMYSVLRDALTDVANGFKETSYIHLGFDEVNNQCWLQDKTVARYLKAHNLTTASLLKEFFIRERKGVPRGRSAIYWDEVVSAGLYPLLGKNDVVQFWHNSDDGLLQQYLNETPATNKALFSAYDAYYLDCGTGNEFGQDSWCDPFKTWRTIFFTDPLKGIRSAAQKERILGGEVALWTEVASWGSLETKLWPRAAAYGGRLWNHAAGTRLAAETNGWVEVELALAAHATRLLGRGLHSDQITPQFCQQQPAMCFPMAAV